MMIKYVVDKRHHFEGVEEHHEHSLTAFDFHLLLQMSIEQYELIHLVEYLDLQNVKLVLNLSH